MIIQIVKWNKKKVNVPKWKEKNSKVKLTIKPNI